VIPGCLGGDDSARNCPRPGARAALVHAPRALVGFAGLYDPGMAFDELLADRVRARESADQQIELKGILHSHPGDMSRPSQGDHYAYEDSLEGAPWLGRLVAPIVTVGTRLRREHDVPLPSGTMSVYIAERRPDAIGPRIVPNVHSAATPITPAPISVGEVVVPHCQWGRLIL